MYVFPAGNQVIEGIFWGLMHENEKTKRWAVR